MNNKVNDNINAAKSLNIKLSNELKQLNITIDDVKIPSATRQKNCEIITEVTKFRLNCVILTSSLISLIKIIKYSIEHYEHAKQQKIYS
jgi:hypothetical protein